MPNTFVNPTQVARTALALVGDDLVLAATVNRDFEANYQPGVGTSVNVRIPATLTARTRALDSTAAITLDDLTETTVPVALDNMAYSAVRVSDEDLTLRIEDFARQVLAPQLRALNEAVEAKVAAELQSVAETTTIAYDATKPADAFAAARKTLRDAGVPTTDLYAAVGTGAYADLLKSPLLRQVDQSGTSAALRDATIGRLHGFTVVESNRLADDEMIFYHADAFALAVRAPVVPAGVTFGQSMAENGFALRWIRDYDSLTLADRSIVSTFLGTTTMPMKSTVTGANIAAAVRVLGSTP